MEVCVATASAAIVQHVPPATVEWFQEWQRGVTAAASSFDGYQGTDLYPPAAGHGDEWVAVVHFEDDWTLQQWLESPVRAQWVDKLRANIGEFELKTLPGGFSLWFAGLSRASKEMPPDWKMALTVLFGLYPTVMLLMIFVAPYTSPLGLAFSMLIGNALSVSILQWFVMPELTSILGPWLEANANRSRGFSVGGLVLIVALLLAISAVFRLVTG